MDEIALVICSNVEKSAVWPDDIIISARKGGRLDVWVNRMCEFDMRDMRGS